MNCYDELKTLFHHFDEDRDGKMSLSELKNCLRMVGHELQPEDVEDVMKMIDLDGDGLLSFDEFAELVNIQEEEEDEERMKYLWEAFRVYEMEGEEGRITAESLKRALERLGNSKTIEECITMITRYDVNGDGVICFDEFKIMMTL